MDLSSEIESHLRLQYWKNTNVDHIALLSLLLHLELGTYWETPQTKNHIHIQIYCAMVYEKGEFL